MRLTQMGPTIDRRTWHSVAMRVILISAVATVVALAGVGSAQAATPAQATTQISVCFKQAGALKITRDLRHGGGTAYFKRPFNAFGHYLTWNYVTSRGKVLGTGTLHDKLTRVERRAINRCLKPFAGHV